MDISETLKATIKARGLTACSVAEWAAVRPHVIQRFLDGERGLTRTTTDQVADVLNLEIRPRTAASTVPTIQAG